MSDRKKRSVAVQSRANDKPARSISLNTQREADQFSRAAADYAKRATSSRDQARRTLVHLGTHTPSGNIAKRYR